MVPWVRPGISRKATQLTKQLNILRHCAAVWILGRQRVEPNWS